MYHCSVAPQRSPRDVPLAGLWSAAKQAHGMHGMHGNPPQTWPPCACAWSWSSCCLQDFQFTATILNWGFAAPINPRPVQLVLMSQPTALGARQGASVPNQGDAGGVGADARVLWRSESLADVQEWQPYEPGDPTFTPLRHTIAGTVHIPNAANLTCTRPVMHTRSPSPLSRARAPILCVCACVRACVCVSLHLRTPVWSLGGRVVGAAKLTQPDQGNHPKRHLGPSRPFLRHGRLQRSRGPAPPPTPARGNRNEAHGLAIDKEGLGTRTAGASGKDAPRGVGTECRLVLGLAMPDPRPAMLKGRPAAYSVRLANDIPWLVVPGLGGVNVLGEVAVAI